MKQLLQKILKVWIFIAFCLFLAIDLANWSAENTIAHYLKFSCIVAFLVLTLLIGPDLHDFRDRTTIQLAAFATVVADFLIGILDLFIAGIAVFILVHVLYSFRHLRGFVSIKKELMVAIPVFLIGAGIIYAASGITAKAGILVPSVIYGVFLATSLYAGIGVTIRSFFPKEDQREILVGIGLFFLVDILVALNAGLEGEAKNISGIAIWALYLPSQYLLSMSGYRKNPTV